MRLIVNGHEHDLPVESELTLQALLRERLRLIGTSLLCDRGECGACTVLLDGEPIYSCLSLAVACDGAQITTLEGIGPAGTRHPLQEAFIAHGVALCGNCMPGRILAGFALLAANPSPSDGEIVEGMSGNLCDCDAYPNIIAAIRSAAVAMRAG